jgi:hypothetical protein
MDIDKFDDLFSLVIYLVLLLIISLNVDIVSVELNIVVLRFLNLTKSVCSHLQSKGVLYFL